MEGEARANRGLVLPAAGLSLRGQRAIGGYGHSGHELTLVLQDHSDFGVEKRP